jgi:transcriptional regulator with XRE-family HTH domain
MPSDFGIMMKECRKRKNLTLDDLAVMVGSSKQVLSRYERGERTPKISAAQKIADALDVPLEMLLGYEYHEDPDNAMQIEIQELEEQVPKTVEARILAKGIDKMSEAQRKAIMTMMEGLYPGLFEEGNENDDT